MISIIFLLLNAVASFEMVFNDVALVDSKRNREINVRVYRDKDLSGKRPVIVVSHGGKGNAQGHTTFEFLAEEFVKHGFLSVHIGHPKSEGLTNAQHLLDRPADVSFVLDELSQRTLTKAISDLNKIGHIGHSYGSYTTFAVAGATFKQGVFRDDRIKAIVGLSPQGDGGFGASKDVDGKGFNTWSTIEIPYLTMLGSLEENGPLLKPQQEKGWRSQPFELSNDKADRFNAVLPGQGHSDMGGKGSEEVSDYIAQNARFFFQNYVVGDSSIDKKEITKQAFFEGTITSQKIIGGEPDEENGEPEEETNGEDTAIEDPVSETQKGEENTMSNETGGENEGENEIEEKTATETNTDGQIVSEPSSNAQRSMISMATVVISLAVVSK